MATTPAVAWSKLKDRVLTVTPGWSEAYGLFTSGEVPMVLSYTTSPAYHMVAEDTDRYQAADFRRGPLHADRGGGHAQMRPGTRIWRREFLSFMTGPAFQDAIPTTNWMLPAGEISKPLPAAFDKLVQPPETLHFHPKRSRRTARRGSTNGWRR